MRSRRSSMGVALAIVALTLCSVAALPRHAEAQPADPAIDAVAFFLDQAPSIGDRVQLVVQVEHPEDTVVTVPRPSVPGSEFVAETAPASTPQPGGAILTTVSFTFQVFALGELQPDPIEVRWVLEDGTAGARTVEPPPLSIRPVRAAGDTALRPIGPPLAIAGAPPAWLRPAIYATAGVAVLLAAGGAALVWRRRGSLPLLAPAPLDYAERVARERLAALRGLDLHEEDDFQQFYGTIAQVVRAYLGERFAFNAAALTTRQLEGRMRRHGVDRWQARLVSGLLDRCDRAVFARQYPDPASADHDLTVAYEIIELSRPRTLDEASELEAVAS